MLSRLPPLTCLAFLSAIMAILAASCGDPKSTNAEAPSATPSASAAPMSTASATAVPEPPASESPPPESPPPEPPPSATLPPDAVDPTAASAEAQRKTLRAVADDPAFYANRNFFAEKYGSARLPLPLSLQTVPLPRGRRALLVTGQGAALEKPLIVVVEADHSITWSKDRPLAGTRERARELTLTRGSRGEVLLFWYDEPTKILAAREWTYEGGIFADYAVLSSEGCDSVAVLHWPGHGWVAVLVDSAALHGQLLSEQGKRMWPGEGVKVPWSGGPSARPAGRPTIAALNGEVVEVTVGKRKIKISREGAVTSAPR